jgi:catechol 2,3-dioxygenase-like lactoylglutathione lyase family enzyme
MPNSFRASPDVIVRTPDFEEAKRFYEGILGLNIAFSSPTLLGFDTGSFRLYVEEGPAHGPVFEFLVPDLESARSALRSAGCIVIEEDPAVPRCYLRDPFGLVFNLAQRAPLVAQT